MEPIPLSEIIYLIIAFVLGLLIGLLIKKIIQIGVILLAIVIILLAIGAISPSTIQNALTNIGVYISQAESLANTFKIYLPYNSIAFIIGLIIGLIRG
ncbi:MAG: hypothetical protein QXV69_05535 [Sulfolobaceae archaeon]